MDTRIPLHGEQRRTALAGTALTQRKEETLSVLANVLELVLKLLDFLGLVLVGRVF